MKIVKIDENKISLADIAGQLRQLADNIESGEVKARSVFAVIAPLDQGEWPEMYGWGEPLNDLERIGLLELAKTWFVSSKTRRHG